MRRYVSGAPSRGCAGLLAAAALFFASAPAWASLDMAELYLRKIRAGERTYFQGGGWRRWRNRLDLFYEADYILGAGTGDPRFVDPDADGDPLGAYSLGGIVLLTEPRSAYQLSFFTMVSRTFEVNTDSTAFTYLPILAPLVPGAFAKERGVSLTQGVTGFQVKFNPWFEVAYGLLMDERRGQRVYRSFVETNLPRIFLHANAVPSPGAEGLERLQAFFSYDQFEWASDLQAGFLRTNINESRNFIYLGFEDLFEYAIGRARVTTDMKLAYAELGVHLSKFEHGDPRRNGKFGFAWDLRLQGSLVNPRYANYWSDIYGIDKISPGFKAEAYIQMPMMSWAGVFTMMLTVSAAALQEDEEEREKTIKQGMKTAEDYFDEADEDDRTYGGLTIGVDMNDPQTLREVPGAVDKMHVYFRFRVLY